jgi:UDP-GlcNAc3NAcA epimerase
MKVITIVGARPQFVKAAAVSRAIKRHNESIIDHGESINELIVHTGQHYDRNLSQVFFEELGIPAPHLNLGVGSGSHGEITGAMLGSIEKTLMNHKPDYLLVFGDTNSTLAGALAASKLQIPVAHVEAGLRSYNRRMPEEINRVVTDHLSTVLFCPTQIAVNNLNNEGIDKGVLNVGDVMYDSVLHYKSQARKPDRDLPFALATIHRAENTDDHDQLGAIFEAMQASPVPIVLPLHPRTRKMVATFGIHTGEKIIIIEPIPYFSLLGYLDACEFVITDSGGLQKEAYFFEKKCITVRDETEWVELVEGDVNKIVSADKNKITQAFGWAVKPMAHADYLYGRGDASDRIVKYLTNH